MTVPTANLSQVTWALPLAVLTFAAPMVLWGALAAAGPVIIHLMLRSKPQPMPLPTIRFILKTQRQTQAIQRLKHLLLLLLRSLIILALVGALARPKLHGVTLPASSRGPVDAIVCLDDSASMGYRSQSRSTFERACEQAVLLLRDRDLFPAGSRVAWLAASAPAAAGRLSLDISYCRSQIAQLEVGQHGRGVATMLERAYALLNDGGNSNREIHLFGDVMRHAWRDVPTGTYTSRKDVRVYCYDMGSELNANYALSDMTLPDRNLPVGVPIRIRFGLQAGQLAGRRSVDILLNDKVRWRQGAIDLAPYQVVQLSAELTGLAPGLHQGEVRLSPEDPLPMDNTRYFSLLIGSQPKVALVGPPDSEVISAVKAMLTPYALPSEQQRTQLSQVAPERFLDLPDLKGFSTIFLADMPLLSSAMSARLGDYLSEGGWLVVIPGPKIARSGYQSGANVLAAVPTDISVPKEPLRVAPLEKTHPLLKRFQDGSGLSISEPQVVAHARFAPLPSEAQAIAQLTDGTPAIVVRSVGRGTSITLAFSPTRAWGDWATDAGPILVLLNTIIGESTGRAVQAGSYRVGQAAKMSLSPASQPGIGSRHVTIQCRNDPHLTLNAETDANSATVTLPTDRCGNYRIRLQASESEEERGYSVNTPPEESQLDRFPVEAIQERFAPGAVRVIRDISELETGGSRTEGTRELAGPLAMIVLALLLMEGLLSNRFYRTEPSGSER